MTTLKDIAREAGVSITTVSNVIHNKKSRVSPELVSKIHEIIKRENYIPSMTARTLANNASPIIGIINHTMFHAGGGFMADPFHNIFMGSIEDCMREHGYFVMVRTVEDPGALETVHRNWNLAGMILTGLFQDEFFERLHSLKIPYVLIDSYINLPEVYNVGLEDKKGGYIATKRLLDGGHRSIAFTGPKIQETGVVSQRLDGYKQALSEFGLPFDPGLVYEVDITIDEGIKLGELLSRKKDVTGIFSSADILAAGIMTGLRSKGVNVPDDKSIIGFDDNYLCRITSPQLTTIHQDAHEKGVIATEMMLAQLQGKTIPNRNVVLPVRLVERESVRDI
ncbi:MAG: LacI family transcriptional regulator [Oscillospiraceae bacterium]|nr:LacI family transcriptional regulator [Oscillospiraceae bacterium]